MIKERIAVQPGAPLETDMWLDISGASPILKVNLNGSWVPISCGGSAQGSSGGAASSGISLDDVTLVSSISGLPVSEQYLSKTECAEKLGITEDELDGLLNGDYLRFAYTLPGGIIYAVTISECVRGFYVSIGYDGLFLVELNNGAYAITGNPSGGVEGGTK